MEEADFKKIQWETRVSEESGFYISKDKKYMRYDWLKTEREALNLVTDELLDELKEKQIIPKWLYIYHDKNCIVSENRPNAVFKQELTAADINKINKKIKTLWEVDFSRERYLNTMWSTSLFFFWKSKYYHSKEFIESDDLERYRIRFAYIKCERIIRKFVTKNEWVVAHNNLSKRSVIFIDDEPYFIRLYGINLSMPLWDICAFKNNSNYNVKLSDSLEENEIRFYHAFSKWIELTGFTDEEISAMPNYYEEKARFRKIWEEFMLPYKKLEAADMENYFAADRNEVIEYFAEVAKETLKLQSPFAYNELKIFHYHWIEALFMRKVFQLWGLMRDNSPLSVKKNSSFMTLRKHFLKNSANEEKLRTFMNSKDANTLKSDKFFDFYKVYRDGALKSLRNWANPKDYIAKATEVIRLVASPARISEMMDFLLFNDYSFSLEDRYELFQKLLKI